MARPQGAFAARQRSKGAGPVFSQISFVDIFNFCVFLTFTICYTYQLYYVFVVPSAAQGFTAIRRVISARNESAVIGDLIHSIKVQNYPSELIDVFVIADNCTDDTARVAREAGAIVFPRSNDKEVGKGYALDYGFQCIRERYADKGYEAYFVFDADNVLDVNYFREMNKTFDNGAKASTSYRNSKNYDSNWISAGYAVWFLREAKFLNQARLTLNTSCAVSGTGFFIAADIIEKNGGWKWHLLTEDIEFSANSILEGMRISYTPTAILYDEQPITFRDSWNQRFRWAKGFYQVFWHYGARLAKGIAVNPKGARFACYDMLTTIAPGCCVGAVQRHHRVPQPHRSHVHGHHGCLLLPVLPAELLHLHVHVRRADHVRGMGLHPFHHGQEGSVCSFLFMLTCPHRRWSRSEKCNWKPIKHSISVDVAELSDAASAAPQKQRRRTIPAHVNRYAKAAGLGARRFAPVVHVCILARKRASMHEACFRANTSDSADGPGGYHTRR